MKRILLIEFERNVRLFMSVNLRARGYEVMEPKCPSIACEMLKHPPPDVILLDTHFFDQWFFNLLNNLNHIPVLLITTEEEERLSHQGRPRITQKLMKPVSLPDLMKAVEAALMVHV